MPTDNEHPDAPPSLPNPTATPALTRAQGLSAKQEKAAWAIADDSKPDHAIAADLGINRDTLSAWKRLPLFAARVNEHRETIKQEVLNTGIAMMQNRVKRQNERAEALDQVRAARALANADLPGGASGLVVRQVKFVKVFELLREKQKALLSGEIDALDLTDDDFIATKQTVPVEEHAIDTGMLAEYRNLENIIAVETGQRVEKKEINGQVELIEQAAQSLDAKLLSAMGTGTATGVPE